MPNIKVGRVKFCQFNCHMNLLRLALTGILLLKIGSAYHSCSPS